MKTILANNTNYSSRTDTTNIKYIVIHYTANNGDTAEGNCKYFQGANRNASAHYFVDENEVCQSVLDKDKAWHSGSENGKYVHKYARNDNSVGIELCSRKDSKDNYYFKDSTVKNAIEIIKILMYKYDIPIENVIRHYDVTGKSCPRPFVKDLTLWNNFKNELMKVEGIEMVTQTEILIDDKKYTVNRILKDGKNYIELRSFEQAGYKVGYKQDEKLATFSK